MMNALYGTAEVLGTVAKVGEYMRAANDDLDYQQGTWAGAYVELIGRKALPTYRQLHQPWHACACRDDRD
jgi:hypothetical protein